MKYFRTDMAMDVLVDAVDFDALFERIIELYSGRYLAGTPIDRLPFERDTCLIKVMPSREIEELGEASGLATGFAGSCAVGALFFSPGLILVTRVDWKGPLAHEMTHWLQHRLGRAANEKECRWMEDAVA